MKKLLTIAALASAAVVYADPISVDVGTVGVTKITTSAKNTIIVTSYSELDGTTDKMAVSNAVKTANLTDGDKIYVLNDSATGYEGYTLASGHWVKDFNYPVTSAGLGSPTSSTTPDIPTLDVGAGFWLSLKDPPSSSKEIIVYGKPPSETNVVVAAGKTVLIGNPTQETLRPRIPTANTGDKIKFFVGNSTLPTGWVRGSDGWYDPNYDQQTLLPEFPAGTGFWYISKGPSDVTVNWQ